MTYSQIIEQIKLKGTFPDDSYFSSSELLTIIDESMTNSVVPLLMRLDEDYFTDSITVIGQREVRIPKRAIGSMVKQVFLNDNLLNRTDDNSYSGYTLKKNTVRLTFEPSVNDRLEIQFFSKPNKASIVESKITEISGLNVTLNSVPSSLTNGLAVLS